MQNIRILGIIFIKKAAVRSLLFSDALFRIRHGQAPRQKQVWPLKGSYGHFSGQIEQS